MKILCRFSFSTNRKDYVKIEPRLYQMNSRAETFSRAHGQLRSFTISRQHLGCLWCQHQNISVIALPKRAPSMLTKLTPNTLVLVQDGNERIYRKRPNTKPNNQSVP